MIKYKYKYIFKCKGFTAHNEMFTEAQEKSGK